MEEDSDMDNAMIVMLSTEEEEINQNTTIDISYLDTKQVINENDVESLPGNIILQNFVFNKSKIYHQIIKLAIKSLQRLQFKIQCQLNDTPQYPCNILSQEFLLFIENQTQPNDKISTINEHMQNLLQIREEMNSIDSVAMQQTIKYVQPIYPMEIQNIQNNEDRSKAKKRYLKFLEFNTQLLVEACDARLRKLNWSCIDMENIDTAKLQQTFQPIIKEQPKVKKERIYNPMLPKKLQHQASNKKVLDLTCNMSESEFQQYFEASELNHMNNKNQLYKIQQDNKYQKKNNILSKITEEREETDSCNMQPLLKQSNSQSRSQNQEKNTKLPQR